MPPTTSDITIYKDGLVKTVDRNSLAFWLSSGWSTQEQVVSNVVESTFGNVTDFFTGTTSTGDRQRTPYVEEFMEDWTVVVTAPDGTRITYGQLYRDFPTIFPPPGTITPGEFNREATYKEWIDSFLASFGGGDGDDEIDLGIGGGGGGGGVRGSTGPTYVKPDERLVRDAVQARLVALTGINDKAHINRLTDLYMSEDRRRFDQRETQDVDPMRSVQAEIEKMGEYKAIHKLRPESEDPMQWIASRKGSMLRAGVSVARSDKMAVQQATVAATQEQAARAGQIATFNDTGQLLPAFFQGATETARAAARLL